MAEDRLKLLVRDIRKLLGVRRSIASEVSEHLDGRSDAPLAWFGFPQLSAATFYPSAQACERLEQDRVLLFPSMCCVCGAAPAVYLAPAQLKGWFQRVVPGPLVACVPHCHAHAQYESARVIVQLYPTHAPFWHVLIVGFHAEFLQRTCELNVKGEPRPPWLTFPGSIPESAAWRQGEGERYFLQVWKPFWNTLGIADRRIFLDRWQAPVHWRSWLDSELPV